MWSASRAAAAEVADADIRVNMLFPGMTNTAIWGRDMSGMQDPDAVYPCARFLAALPTGGPNGTVFYRERPYEMFGDNEALLAEDRAEIARRRAEKEAAME